MKLKNINKNLLGSIVIIVSLLLVFSCVAMLIFSQPDSYGGQVKWNGLTFVLPPDSTYASNNQSFIVNSSINSYNIIVDKTTNLNDYNSYIASDVTGTTESSYNSTHRLLMNKESCYAAIVEDELIKDNPSSNPYVLNDNVEIVEFRGKDAKYMASFISSSYVG